MTIIIATVRADGAWLSSDSLLWTKTGMLQAEKVKILPNAKAALVVSGTFAMAEGIRYSASRRRSIAELEVKTPELLRLMPAFVTGEIWHVGCVGWDDGAGRARGFTISCGTGYNVEAIDGTVFEPDFDMRGPHAYRINKWISDGIWARRSTPEAEHRRIAENQAWQAKQGHFAGYRIGGHLQTAIVTRDGVRLIDGGDLDAQAAA